MKRSFGPVSLKSLCSWLLRFAPLSRCFNSTFQLLPRREADCALGLPNTQFQMPADHIHRLRVSEIGALFEVFKAGAKRCELIHGGRGAVFHSTN